MIILPHLPINPEKSSALIIPSKITPPITGIQLHFSNNSVALEDSIKYLEITIDTKLRFDVCLNILARKISWSLGFIKKRKQILPQKTLRSLCYTMIHPYPLYANYYLGKYLHNPFETTKISLKQSS